MLDVTVSAIVVSWNSMPLIQQAVDSVRRQTHRPVEIIVVDNGSTDGTLAWLRQQPDLQVLANSENLGFAAANNQGIGRAVGDILLLANADVELGPEYLEACVARFADPGVGSVTGKLLRVDSQQTIDSTGHEVYAIGWAQNRGEEFADVGFDQSGEVFGVCAAAGLYRREAMLAVTVDGQVFDEAYISYIEDVDLDWRLRWNGWHAWYEPSAIGRHHRHGSGGPASSPVMRNILKNRLLTVVKNYPLTWLVRYSPGIAAFTLVKTVDFGRRRPAAALGLVDFVFALPTAMRWRRAVQAISTVPEHQVRGWLLPFPWRARAARRVGKAAPVSF